MAGREPSSAKSVYQGKSNFGVPIYSFGYRDGSFLLSAEQFARGFLQIHLERKARRHGEYLTAESNDVGINIVVWCSPRGGEKLITHCLNIPAMILASRRA